MPTPGIMEQIRTLLSQGKSSTEVINLGFKPGTVFEVQRRMAEEGMGYAAILGNPQAKNHEPPEASTVRLPHRIENLDPQVEDDPDILKLKVELRKAQLQNQLDELKAHSQLESRIVALENQMQDITAEFRGLEHYVYACPLSGLREDYQCSCGAEDQLAVRVVCTNCDNQEEYSWWARLG